MALKNDKLTMATPTVSKSKKPLVIGLVALGALIVLGLFFFIGQQFVGQAIQTTDLATLNVGEMGFNYATVTGAPDDTFTAMVKANLGLNKASSVQVTVNYPANLELVSYDSNLPWGAFNGYPGTNSITLVDYNLMASAKSPDATGNAGLFTLTFRAKSAGLNSLTLTNPKVYAGGSVANLVTTTNPTLLDFKTAAEPVCVDNDDDGFPALEGCGSLTLDCNDADATIHEGAPESCDGKDNNCDGIVDNGVIDLVAGTGCCNGNRVDLNSHPLNCGDCGVVCPAGQECQSGLCKTVSCTGTAPSNTKQAGVCAGSVRSCISTTLGFAWQDNYDAIAAYEATEVTCDQLDNDCDGSTNEGIDSCCNGVTVNFQIDERNCGACNNDCGYETCTNGVCSLSEIPVECIPTIEVCDTLDNDCDGAVNEGLNCGTTDPTTLTVGQQIDAEIAANGGVQAGWTTSLITKIAQIFRTAFGG